MTFPVAPRIRSDLTSGDKNLLERALDALREKERESRFYKDDPSDRLRRIAEVREKMRRA